MPVSSVRDEVSTWLWGGALFSLALDSFFAVGSSVLECLSPSSARDHPPFASIMKSSSICPFSWPKETSRT